MKKKVYIISFIIFIIDLLSKILVLGIDKTPITIINNFFYINKIFNTGAAFSLFTGNNFILIIIAIAVLIYIDRKVIDDIKSKISVISISMLIGGIIGNLFDRIVYGKVIDFLRGDLNGNKSR